MKKILIFSHAMEIGGAEKALLGLLENIDQDQYHVDLFLMRHQGELLKEIPEGINLLPEKRAYSCLAVPFKEVIKKRQFGVAIGRYLGKRAAQKKVRELKLGDNDVSLQYSHKYTLKYMPLISDTEYDLAISFLTPHYFVANKVKAKTKLAWIHTDYSYVQMDRASQLVMWDCYDKIASISDQVTKSFITVFPELESKVIKIENMLPIQYISRLANEPLSDEKYSCQNGLKLLSIGRFCNAKNFDNVPYILKELRKKNIDAFWYLIGFGTDEIKIRDAIQKTETEEYVIILGKKENPYPYIQSCDFYIQPSRYEGKCVSVIEAQILNKPVIITDYPTSPSQLHDGQDGVIVPLENEKAADGIADLISNSDKQRFLIKNTEETDYSNREGIQEIYKLIH